MGLVRSATMAYCIARRDGWLSLMYIEREGLGIRVSRVFMLGSFGSRATMASCSHRSLLVFSHSENSLFELHLFE